MDVTETNSYGRPLEIYHATHVYGWYDQTLCWLEEHDRTMVALVTTLALFMLMPLLVVIL